MTTQCAEEKVGQHTGSLPLQPRRARVPDSVCQRIDPDAGQAYPRDVRLAGLIEEALRVAG